MGPEPLRQCAIFRNNFKLICPVQRPQQKYSASRETQITPTSQAIPSREEGRWPSSRTLGRVAVDAAASDARGVRRAVIRERTSRADERRLNAFVIASAGMHLSGRSWWRRKLRTAKPCGPGARCWRQAGGGLQSPTGRCEPSIRQRWRQEGIRLQGEHGISRKAIARGMPGCSGCTCMLVCAFLSASCTRDRGCQPAPGIPCAL
jgi:hypothetical protein